VPDRDDENDQDVMPYRINDPIITHANAMEIVVSCELPRSRRERPLRQSIDGTPDPDLHLSGQGSELPLRSSRKLDRV